MSGLLHNPGDVVGERYRVDKYVGEGGMQEVYLAFDSLLSRYVALKSPKGASAEKRFKRSAVVSARVNHANVAKTLDYFEHGQRPYLVEEFVDGCNLAQFLRGYVGNLDPYSVAKVMHRLAKGVQASHHANVAHRDLKPSNIMIYGGDRFDDVKITDFGIAKLAEKELGEAVEGGSDALTASATALGALPYMAPEMIDDFKSAGKPADIWALGAMTFELLTGKKPFGDGYKAVTAIQKAVLPPLPVAITRGPQFSVLATEIYAILTDCLTKDPLSRIDADELVQRCGALCYNDQRRTFGTIATIEFDKYGRITPDGGGRPVFWHISSMFNVKPAVGQRVWFSSYPGSPFARAFPVVAARTVEKDQG